MLFTGIFYSVAIGINPVLVRTATAAIDVATISIGSTAVNAGVCNTYPTAMNGDGSIMIGVTILATTIDRTLNLRICGFIVADDDVSVIDPCQLVLDFTWLTHITS